MKKLCFPLLLAVSLLLLGSCTTVRTLPDGVQRFVNNGDGTITDNATGLMWEAETGNRGEICLFSDAEKYASTLRLGGYDDWRLPSIGQLKTLLDEQYQPRINTIFECKPGKYWSRNKGRYKKRFLTRMALDFQDGEPKHYLPLGFDYYVRAVRRIK